MLLFTCEMTSKRRGNKADNAVNIMKTTLLCNVFICKAKKQSTGERTGFGMVTHLTYEKQSGKIFYVAFSRPTTLILLKSMKGDTFQRIFAKEENCRILRCNASKSIEIEKSSM